MELIKKEVLFNCQKSRETIYFSKEESFNLNEMMEDIAFILQKSGEIKVLEVKKETGKVRVLGEVSFSILYMSASLDKRLAGFSGRMSFEEDINVDGLEETDEVSLEVNLEDISIEIVNSRKVRANAMIAMTVSAENKCGEEVLSDVETTDSAIQIKKGNLKFLNKKSCLNENVTIEENLQLQSGYENVGKIIWFNVVPANVDFKYQDGQIAIFGDLQVFVVYQSEAGEKSEFVQEMVPFHQMISCNECSEEVIVNCRFNTSSCDVEVVEDYDGEERALHISCVLDLNICMYVEETTEYVEDIYSVRDSVVPETSMLNSQKLLSQNTSKCRINEILNLDNVKTSILQLLFGNGKLKNVKQTQSEGGVLVEGTISAFGLYITSDDDKPYDKFEGELSFKHFVEIPHMDMQSEYKMDCRLEQISLNMAGENAIEVKALVSMQVLAYDIVLCPVILEIKVEDIDSDRMQKIPGITGYVVGEEESLWDIAKKYMTTVDALKDVNDITSDYVHQNDTIIIVKSVGEGLSKI